MKKIYNILIVFCLMIFYIESLGVNVWAETKDRKSLESAYSEMYTSNTIPSMQVYVAIKKYCAVYNVPVVYAFRVARFESGWKGPSHLGYTANDKISVTNALGVMQVLPSTAKHVWKNKSITDEQLLNDIDFNVHTGIKYMRQLYNIECHNDWPQVFAYYNTGYTSLNDYALNVVK